MCSDTWPTDGEYDPVHHIPIVVRLLKSSFIYRREFLDLGRGGLPPYIIWLFSLSFYLSIFRREGSSITVRGAHLGEGYSLFVTRQHLRSLQTLHFQS